MFLLNRNNAYKENCISEAKIVSDSSQHHHAAHGVAKIILDFGIMGSSLEFGVIATG